ncbi:cell division protein FtsX [Sphingomonas flavalba]|uniref:cell division protein FtsX n=1 Tax=Sphingomonas flavalba TaxID=2559804 RepID=UPI00109DF051|nr:FtsX-like permease family protein [Sphingomonas flavalba]
MSLGWTGGGADRRLLPEGWLAGPMPWVIAIMVFLTVLAVAGGLGMANAAGALRADLAGRVTVQVIAADPAARAASADRVAAALGRLSNVRAVHRVDDAEIAALLRPWLGVGDLAADLPVPALIDVDLTRTDDRSLAELAKVAGAGGADVRVDAHARWLAPLARLVGSLQWLAAAVVVLMGVATAAAVVLAARAALNTHRATIDVLHLLGATDIQIARLFQRRIALDALFGGAIGLGVGATVILLVGGRIQAVGSDLVGAVTLSPAGWLMLLAVPAAATLLATLAARLTVVRALRRIL